MTDEFDPTEARRLWRQASLSGQGRARHVSALDLAAWLDGTADAELSARVERGLAEDEKLLDTALAARRAADSPEAVPERLLVRARAMVAPPVTAMRPGGILSRLGAWQRRMEWAAIGASFVIAASGGFWIGDGLSDNVARATERGSITLLGVDEETTRLFDGEL